MIDLFDNPKVDVPYSHSEEYRHRCEVRWLIAERIRRGKDGKMWLRGYLEKVPLRRDRLEKDIKSQWLLGNRGEPSHWAVN